MGLLVLLVGHNVWVFMNNQRELPADQRLHVSNRDLERMSLENSHLDVHGRFALLYFFEKFLNGKHLTVPPSWRKMAGLLERVSRVDVEVSRTNIVIEPRRVKQARRLSHRVGTTRRWYYGRIRTPEGNLKRKYQYVQIVIAKRYDRYVLAETTTGRDLFLLPEKTYERYRAEPGVLPGPRAVMSETP
jgi:hypothetical protein